MAQPGEQIGEISILDEFQQDSLNEEGRFVLLIEQSPNELHEVYVLIETTNFYEIKYIISGLIEWIPKTSLIIRVEKIIEQIPNKKHILLFEDYHWSLRRINLETTNFYKVNPQKWISKKSPDIHVEEIIKKIRTKKCITLREKVLIKHMCPLHVSKYLKINDELYAKDATTNIYKSTIVDADSTHYKIHYNGWSSKFDERIVKTSPRLYSINCVVSRV